MLQFFESVNYLTLKIQHPQIQKCLKIFREIKDIYAKINESQNKVTEILNKLIDIKKSQTKIINEKNVISDLITGDLAKAISIKESENSNLKSGPEIIFMERLPTLPLSSK
jgi:hypothetical protein